MVNLFLNFFFRFLILCIILPILFLYALFTYTTLILSYIFPFPRLKRYAKALLSEFYALIKLIFGLNTYSYAERPRRIKNEPKSPIFMFANSSNANSDANPPKTPILYAPGYLDTPATFIATARILSANTQSPIYLLQYKSFFQSIHEHSQDIITLAERIRTETNQSDIILLGHSMGGLTTGNAISTLQSLNFNVKKWITIASPLQGTSLAYLGLGQCCKDMRPNSNFLSSFNPPNTPSFHLQADVDWIVPAKKKNPYPMIRVLETGHISVREVEPSQKHLATNINLL